MILVPKKGACGWVELGCSRSRCSQAGSGYERGHARRLGEMRLGWHRTEVAVGEGQHCSYCGKEPDRHRKLVERGEGRYICTECTERLIAELASAGSQKPGTR